MSALFRISVGVVVERRKAMSQWTDFIWQPVAVLPDVPDATPWTVIKHDADRTSFYAGPAIVEFHTTETSHYRDNLTAGAKLWVVLRPTEAADPAYQIACVTAAMWASVNEPRSDEPRCPLVPKLTSWVGSSGSGVRS